MIHNVVSIRLSDDPEDAAKCRRAVMDVAERMGFTDDDKWGIVSGVFEAYANGITHGKVGQSGSVSLLIRAYHDRFEAVITDTGPGFTCPVDSPIPPATSPRGRGIPLMNTFMDEVRVDLRKGCRMTLVKYLPSDAKRRKKAVVA